MNNSGIVFTIKFQLLCIGFILTLFIFQEGLLIKKQTITDQKSKCSDVNVGTNCWIAPVFERAVVILIDALRFDFVNPNIQDDTYYHGSMPKIGNYLKNYRNNSRLYKFIADPPTTTMQRITGMITGSIPTFIEAGENFAATEIMEDNLLSQLKSLNRTTVLLGDDTWINLLPNTFSRSFAMDSFDVKDLDTVDSAIKPKLFEEMENKNFSLLISHFLGVDHCGHRYGPNHPEMKRKLNEMDDVVANVIDKLDEKTILFVFGDHGMDPYGNHGGDALLEVEAALFVYSKKSLPSISDDKYSTVSQIDLLPTISLLLDIPIPFSNLGALIEDLFNESSLNLARKMNVMQVMRYISTYNFQNPSVQKAALHTMKTYESQTDSNSSSVIHELREHIFKTINNFDLILIYVGLISFFECLMTFYSLLLSNTYQTSFVTFVIFRSSLLLLQCAIYFGGKNVRDDNSTLIYLAVYLSIAYNLTIIFVASIGLKLRAFLQLIPIILPIFLCIGLFSNSFIVYGSIMGRFLLSTLVFCTALYSIRSELLITRLKFSDKRLIKQTDFTTLGGLIFILIVIRFGANFSRCREEQVDCYETMFAASTGLDESIRLTRIAVGVISTTLCLAWIQHKQQHQSIKICFSFAWLGLLVIYFNWSCEALNAFRQTGIYSAQIVYAICLIIILSSIIIGANFYEFFQSIRIVTFLVFSLLLGDGTAIFFALITIANSIWQQNANNFDSSINAIFYFLLNHYLFYALGHNATFASIPWTAAFVGLPSMQNKILPAALIILHLYSGTIFCTIEGVVCQPLRVMHLFVGLEALKTFITCISGFIQRRHLMFFKVFAPNFLFQAIGFLLLSIFVIVIQTGILMKRK